MIFLSFHQKKLSERNGSNKYYYAFSILLAADLFNELFNKLTTQKNHSNRLQNDSFPWFLYIFFAYSVRITFLRHYQYGNAVRDLNHTKIIDFSFVSCTAASRVSLLIQANAFSDMNRALSNMTWASVTF